MTTKDIDPIEQLDSFMFNEIGGHILPQDPQLKNLKKRQIREYFEKHGYKLNLFNLQIYYEVFHYLTLLDKIDDLLPLLT